MHVCYPVTAIEFENAPESLLSGETVQLRANVTAREQNFMNKLVTFSSSDESVAKVDANGLIIAASPGTATITASASSGITAECIVIVRELNTLTLPAYLTTIEDEAFVGANMERVILAENVINIGNRAFAECESLLIVRMPDSIVSIADDAFEDCENVTFICESENVAAAYAVEHNIPYRIE